MSYQRMHMHLVQFRGGALLFWQMMFHPRGFIVLLVPFMEWITKYWKHFSCLCCWQMQHETCGTHWKFNAAEFIVSVSAGNKPGLLNLPEAQLLNDKTKSIKKFTFLVIDVICFKEMIVFLWLTMDSGSSLFSTFRSGLKKAISLRKLWYPAR